MADTIVFLLLDFCTHLAPVAYCNHTAMKIYISYGNVCFSKRKCNFGGMWRRILLWAEFDSWAIFV